jgi:hypothetical protein
MLVSHDVLVNSARAGVDLVRDGIFRLGAALEHAGAAPRRVPPGDGARRRTSEDGPLALIFLTTLLLAAFTHDAIRIGPNLVTAELLVAVAAAARLLTGRRLRTLSTSFQPVGR